VRLLQANQVYRKRHRDALLNYPIQAQVTRKRTKYKGQSDQHISWFGQTCSESTPFLFIHGLISLRHEFTKRDGMLGIEPRQTNTE
jgi:hypothetical protein